MILSIHCKKRLADFPSPAAMSLTKTANLFYSLHSTVLTKNSTVLKYICFENAVKVKLAVVSWIYRKIQCCGCFSRSRITDPTFFHPGSWIRIFPIPDPHQRIKYFNPRNWFLSSRKWFLSSRKYEPGCSSRVPDPGSKSWLLTHPESRIPDPYPGVKTAPDPGSRIRICNTGKIKLLWRATLYVYVHSS